MMSQRRLREECNRVWRRAIDIWMFAALSIVYYPTGADITTDGTVGPATNLTGPDFEIGADLGTTRGTNLFHSFHTFNVDVGESATFTGPASIDNVISRVTGGGISSIDGLLRSEVGTADFYFINPAGVVLGPNAQVDVPAAFHVSTADELRFQDGAVFSASTPDSSTLSVEQPESFGFLSPQSASLTVNGSQLVFTPTSHISVSASGVTVQDGANLLSEGGVVHVTAIGESENAVAVASGSMDSPGDGTIAIHGSSILDASGSSGDETVELRGGAIEVEDSAIAANNSGSLDGVGRILLEADSVRVINSDIGARVSGAGNGNDVVVIASELEVDAATVVNGFSRLMTRVLEGATGQAGDVRVEADRVSLTNGGQISSIVEQGAGGTGGDVEVRAVDSVTIEGANGREQYSGIYTMTLSADDADGGSIVIDAPQARITIADGGILHTGTVGMGNAGSITLSAGVIELHQGSLNVSTYSFGNAGEIHLEVGNALQLTQNSSINAYSDKPPVDLRYGDAGSVSIDTGSLSMEDSYINVFSCGRANAGSIEIGADEINLDNTTGETITSIDAQSLGEDIIAPNTTLITSEEGRSGTITLDAANIKLDHGVRMSIDTFVGNGGSIDIRAEELNLLNGSKLSAVTAGEGRGGDVYIDVSGTFLTEGGLYRNGNNWSGGITTSPTDSDRSNESDISVTGPAGAISITAGALVVGQHNQIMSSSFSNAPSGQITLNVGTLEVKDGGEVRASAGSEGPGGNIVITAQEAVRVYGVDPDLPIDSSEILSDANFSGEGGIAGSIVVETPLLLLERGGRLSAENKEGAVGGAITVLADELFIRSGGEISTSSYGSGGVAGSIQIDADHVSINHQGSVSLNALLQRTGLFSGPYVFTDSNTTTGDAGVINVTARETIELLSGGLISTGAINATGSPITIDGGVLRVDNSLITTSVLGEQGNGGDITLSPELLVLNSGFIQANTTAPLASGGNIIIDANALLASGGNVQVGGVDRAVFQSDSGINVIQAAAPDGVEGNITITAPELDISGTLSSLESGFLEPVRLGSDVCRTFAGEVPSSLVQGGRGGVPAGPEESAGVSFGGYRLDRLLSIPPAPGGKGDGSEGVSNGYESDAGVDQAIPCKDGSNAGSLQYLLLR